MKHTLHNLATEARHIRLTKAEKAAMRLALKQAMAEGAAISGRASPVRVEKSPYVFSSFFGYQARMVMAGLLMFVLVGVGTTSAAHYSLPGDMLYPVKLSINERVEKVLAADPVEKAAVEVRLAERRVEEAQTLSAQGRLDERSAETLAVTFDAHAQNAETLAAAVEDRAPGTVVQVRTKLASSVAVGSAVLKKLGRESRNEKNKEQSEALSARVIARAEGAGPAAGSRSVAAFAPSPKAAPSSGALEIAMLSVGSDAAPVEEGSEKAAAHLQKKAAEMLAEAHERLEKLQQGLGTTTAAQVKEKFSVAEESMSRGSSALGGGQYAEAEAHFTEVLRIAAKLEALLRAEEKFDNGIINELLEGEVLGAAAEEVPEEGEQPAAPFGTPYPIQTDARL